MEKEITFIEDSHQYIRNGIQYNSVSSVIEFFQEPFPEQIMSNAVAKKRGVEQAVVLKEWEDKRNEACKWGKAVHTALEKIEQGEYDPSKVYEEYKGRIYPITESYKSWREEVTGKSNPEMILFDDATKVAGTCDLPMFRGKHVDIYDFKTNEKIDYVSKYDKYMRAPFSFLTDCKFTRYGIQLSIYAYLLELSGSKVGKLCILWFDEDGKIHEIYVPYMKQLAEQMLTLYRALNPID